MDQEELIKEFFIPSFEKFTLNLIETNKKLYLSEK